jgi:type II secretory pathway pseudopilin PulG
MSSKYPNISLEPERPARSFSGATSSGGGAISRLNSKNPSVKQNQQSSRHQLSSSSHDFGFTIIEVALVLAIAGLIFLVVFLALPALQRSQRDTARRQDVARVVSALQSYMADNGGSLPVATPPYGSWQTIWGTLYGAAATGNFSGYVGSLSQATAVAISTPHYQPYGSNDSGYVINVMPGWLCPGASGTASSNNAAVNIKLESGGTYCQSV